MQHSECFHMKCQYVPFRVGQVCHLERHVVLYVATMQYVRKDLGRNSVQLVWVTAHYSGSACGVSALLFLSDIASNRGERLALSFCTTTILHYLCTAFICSNDFILH